MPVTPTYDLIASNVLSSSASSVTFSSIPATYRDLIVVVTGKTLANADVEIQVNGLTTSIYTLVNMYGDGSSGQSGTDSNTLLKVANEARFNATNVSSVIIQIMDYSATDKHKTVLSRANSSGIAVEASAGRIATTNAINEVKFLPQASSFDTGTSFYLYGIVS